MSENKVEIDPKKIYEHLNQSVIGQEEAKRVLSVGIYNHFKRLIQNVMSQPKEDDIELDKSNIILVGPTGSGKTLLAQTIANCFELPFTICDCTKLTQTGYYGEDPESVVTNLLRVANFDVEKTEKGIIFLDEVDKIKLNHRSNGPDVGGRGVQQALLKLVEGYKVSVPKGSKYSGNCVSVNTKNILFIASGAFVGVDKLIEKQNTELSDIHPNDIARQNSLLKQIEPKHLIQFGMIPEFIGRFPIVVALESLTESKLVSIMTEPKNALMSQYEKLFQMDHIRLEFEKEAMQLVARQALERGTGARGLRAIMDKVMLDLMFESPNSNVEKIVVTKDVVLGKDLPQYTYKPEPVHYDTCEIACLCGDINVDMWYKLLVLKKSIEYRKPCPRHGDVHRGE